MEINCKKLSCNATIPRRVTTGSAGFDLYASESVQIHSGQTKAVKTDISLVYPEGYYGLICGRSGFAKKYAVFAFNGVCDSDYTGDIQVILHNTSANNFAVNCGDRIAQILILPNAISTINEVSTIKRITERSNKGFGSSGKHD